MDLIKEIAKERLVIMVTHNPELAEQYSTRIVRLLDGEIVEDTNPMTKEEVEKEAAEMRLEEEKEEENERLNAEANGKKSGKKNRKEKAKMSFFTAFRLSAKNLISKKGRTAMVGFAGSIGIIGIAMVLAFRAGIMGYVASMQDDMLSGNPITITESTYDLEALTGMMSDGQKEEIIKQPNRVYIDSVVEFLASTQKDFESLLVENDITREYIEYVKAMPKELYAAMLIGYGIDLNANLYTDFKTSSDAESIKISVSRLTSMYTAILGETEFKDYASYVTALAPSMQQLPSNSNYITSQYNLVSGKLAENKNEIVLVLNSEDELSDLLLARFGYYTQDEFLEIVRKATEDDYDEDLYRDSFAYDELIGKTFTWYPNDTVFEATEFMGMASQNYKSEAVDFSNEGAVELEVVGILTTKENVSYGSLSSGIFYTDELTKHILDENMDSEIIDYITDEANSALLEKTYYNIAYTYTYVYDNGDGNTNPKTAHGAVGPTVNMMESMMSQMGGGASAVDFTKLRDTFVRNLGGNDIANNVKIYPLSFDDKDLVTEYLDKWNSDETVTVGSVEYTKDDRQDITYTDSLELIINMINTMIDVISYALIAFTSISLVVSTVMIGIITYVSVVERIKEIGVIRSLGGRKKDVSHLFNAETFIIGLLSGLIGIGATYLISAIANAILKPLINYPNIAALPVSQAILLVLLSIGLTLISGLIPASSAAKKDPVVALRTE